MSLTSSELSQELSAISDRFSDLGERLLTTARQLHAPGTPPSEELVESVTACRRDFLRLRDQTHELASSLHVEHPRVEDLLSLQDLTTLLDELAEAELGKSKGEEVRKRALSTIDRILSLSHSADPEFGALKDLHQKAGSLRDTITAGSWKSLPPESEKLAEGEHAFAHLLALIEDRDELSDELWASMHESVGKTFGRSLAAAAARSKLVFRDHGDRAHNGMAMAGSAH